MSRVIDRPVRRTPTKEELEGAKLRHPTARRMPHTTPARFYVLASVVVVLTLLGLVMVLSASSVEAFRKGEAPWSWFIRQSTFAALGFVALGVCSRLDYRRLATKVPLILLGAFALQLTPFLPGVGRVINGSRSWISIGPLSGQPSEGMKLALLLYCCELLSRRRDRVHDAHKALIPCMVMLVLAAGLVGIQKDLGTAIILGSIVVAVMFISGVPVTQVAGASGALCIGGVAMVAAEPYRRERFFSFWSHTTGSVLEGAYQGHQAAIAIAEGGTTGTGLGAGRSKWGFLPEAPTDFIFAVIGEELGLIGTMLVVGLFVCFTVVGVRIAVRARDRFGMLLAGGITAWVLVQAVVNIGGVVGLMPITGLTLPFVSMGGSSLVVMMAAAGLLLSVARQGRL